MRVVIPAGLAFARSVAQRPELNLYVAGQAAPEPGRHLPGRGHRAGQRLSHRSPVGNSYTAGLPADVVAHLQTIAAETVRDFDAGRR